MTFPKFDPEAFLAGDGEKTFAGLASLAEEHAQSCDFKGGRIAPIQPYAPTSKIRDRESATAKAAKVAKAEQTTRSAADLRARFEVQAALCQLDGYRARASAQARAWNEVAALWYRQHGTRTSGVFCAGCGKALGSSEEVLLLPLGERAHADRGFACIHAYGIRWKGQAAIGLAAIGIPTPAAILAEIEIGNA